MTIPELLNKIATYFLNPIIILGFVVATIVLFWGIFEMIRDADSSNLETNKRKVIYGVIGLFVMFSVYGILRIGLETFGIPCTGFFCKP